LIKEYIGKGKANMTKKEEGRFTGEEIL